MQEVCLHSNLVYTKDLQYGGLLYIGIYNPIFEPMRSRAMMNAARRLLKSDERISDISYSVGYETPNYFARCFKETFGISPQEYRKRSRSL